MLLKLTIHLIPLSWLLVGCVIKPPPKFAPLPPPPPPSSTPLARVDTETFLPWGQEESTLVIVDKTCKTLSVYQHGRLFRTYPVVFGRKPGRKLYQGDRRTPTGLYMIIDKDPHVRWSRFILLDYPNDNDTHRYKQAVSNGTVPKGKNGHPGSGGAIGIHGSDREAFNRAGINWTLGCISMLNPDVKELDTLVSIGTMVYIHE